MPPAEQLGSPSPWRSRESVRIAVVLSAGGLRGAAHVGVLRQLVRHGVEIDTIVGVSAGAVVAAYYSAVGLSFDDLVRDAERFRGRHLLTYSALQKCGSALERYLTAGCGIIPARLQQLQAASFDRLHHGIRRLGVVCHDVAERRPQYFSTGSDRGITVEAAVRASASIPHLFPPLVVTCGSEALRLTDGGISDPVPIAFARSRLVGATHVIVSDCRWFGRVPATEADTVWIRPGLRGTGTLWSPARGLTAAIREGEAAVTPEVVARIAGWGSQPKRAAAAK